MSNSDVPTAVVEILRQLGGNPALTMLGSKGVTYSSAAIYIKMPRSRCLEVCLTSADLYNVRVHNTRTYEITGEGLGVAVSELRSTVEALTGLYLSL